MPDPEKVGHADLDAALESDGIVTDADTPPKPEESKEETPPTDEEGEEKSEEPQKKESKEETPDEDFFGAEQEPEADLPEEPEDNRVRSQLGRRVKAMEDDFYELKGTLEEFLREQRKQRKEPEGEPDFDDFDAGGGEDEVVRMKDLPKLLQKFNQDQASEQRKAQEKYERGYLQSLPNWAEENNLNDKQHRKVCEVMQEHYNIRYSNDPVADSRINYLKALSQILSGVAKQRQNPLSKNQEEEQPPPGGPSGSDSDFRAGEQVQLDDYAAEFVKKSGMGEDSVKKALTGNMPTYLMGKK